MRDVKTPKEAWEDLKNILTANMAVQKLQLCLEFNNPLMTPLKWNTCLMFLPPMACMFKMKIWLKYDFVVLWGLQFILEKNQPHRLLALIHVVGRRMSCWCEELGLPIAWERKKNGRNRNSKKSGVLTLEEIIRTTRIIDIAASLDYHKKKNDATNGWWLTNYATINKHYVCTNHKGNSMLPSTSKVDDVWFMDSSTSNGSGWIYNISPTNRSIQLVFYTMEQSGSREVNKLAC